MRIALGVVCVILSNAFQTSLPWILKLAIDDMQQSVSQAKIVRYVLILLGLAAGDAIFLYYMRWILIVMSRLVEYDMRNDYFGHLQRLHPQFYDVTRTGDLMALATNDLNAVRMMLGPGIMYMINTIIKAVMIFFYMSTLDLRLTLVSLMPFPLMVLTVYYLMKMVHPRFEAIQEQFSAMTSAVQENVSGVRVIKAYAQETPEMERFRRLNLEYIRRSLSLVKVQGFTWPLMTFMFGISIVIVLWIGGAEVISGGISLGTLAAFVSYLTMLVFPVITLGWVLNLYERGMTSLERMNKVLNQTPEILDTLDTVDIPIIHGEIEFRNLTFTYDEKRGQALHNITLKVPQGLTLAVVGRTGSGKSTLVNLIPRMYQTEPGRLLIDGLDIRRIPLDVLRRHIAYVPQETFLFSDTIAENIIFGRRESSEAEYMAAAKIAQIHDEVLGFPQQYQTILGERGINLSGGQKQRVAIARALVRNPQILILDNSLSHVDTHTEEKILAELKKVMRDRTSIIVSDRISTVQHADMIVVLAEGRVVEEGRHETLLALGGIYAGLYQKQLLAEALETD